LYANATLVLCDESAKITSALDKKVPTFFLQPTYRNGERRKPFAFFISPQQRRLAAALSRFPTGHQSSFAVLWDNLIPIDFHRPKTSHVNEVVSLEPCQMVEYRMTSEFVLADVPTLGQTIRE